MNLLKGKHKIAAEIPEDEIVADTEDLKKET
jgi:hypothetical protein